MLLRLMCTSFENPTPALLKNGLSKCLDILFFKIKLGHFLEKLNINLDLIE